MFKRVVDWFTSNTPEAEETHNHEGDLALATAALMMEVARADRSLDASEMEAMLRQLGARLQLDSAALEDLVALAADTSEEAHDLYAFTEVINARYDYAEKKRLLTDLWDVALADEAIDAHEDHIIRRIAGLLNVDHSDLMHARAKARKN